MWTSTSVELVTGDCDSLLREESCGMADGNIKKLTDKGFGFIDTGDGDLFFHLSALVDVQFEELSEGQPVTFDVGEGPKGPRAENVRVA